MVRECSECYSASKSNEKISRKKWRLDLWFTTYSERKWKYFNMKSWLFRCTFFFLFSSFYFFPLLSRHYASTCSTHKNFNNNNKKSKKTSCSKSKIVNYHVTIFCCFCTQTSPLLVYKEEKMYILYGMKIRMWLSCTRYTKHHSQAHQKETNNGEKKRFY